MAGIRKLRTDLKESISDIFSNIVNAQFRKDNADRITIITSTSSRVRTSTLISEKQRLEDRLREQRRRQNIIQFNRTLRSRRQVNPGVLIQRPPFKNPDLLLESFSEVSEDNFIEIFNAQYPAIIKRAHKALYKQGNNIQRADIQYLVVTEVSTDDDEDISGWKHTQPQDFGPKIDINKLIPNINLQESEQRFVIAGFRISMRLTAQKVKDRTGFNKQTIRNLKAFEPTENRDFHEMCIASTSTNRLCIYETFLDIADIRSLKYKRDNTKENEKLLTMLKKEGNDIEASIKKGNLIESLELLTKKYDNEVLIKFYNKRAKMCRDLPIVVNRGETNILDLESNLEKYNNKKCILYEKGKHVAPSMCKFTKDDKLTDIKKLLKKKYVLRPLKRKGYDNKLEGVLAFDFEAYTDENDKAHIYAGCVYGMLKDQIIEKEFYGGNVEKNMIEYFISIATKKDYKKSRPKNKIPYINIYGFNNTNFDNLFIYDELKKMNNATKYIFTNSGIKYMKTHNIRFFDIGAYYGGSLNSVAKDFKLEESKGVFPYKYVKKDNLYDVVNVPHAKYWRRSKDRDIYLLNHGLRFDVKAYTLKYCMLDSKLTYQIAMAHLKNCVGEINGQKYDVSKCPTAANIALKMYQQVFQKNDHKQSPDKIILKEKLAYKGGRTEVFKKQFKSVKGSRLWYVDINSAHPSGMCLNMPAEYINKINGYDKIFEYDDIVDTNLYLCKATYKGNDPYYIPNLLTRTECGNIIASKNTDYIYQWGMEIREAIRDGCEINIREEHQYKADIIFDKFANYFYNERKKIKKSNTSLAQFYKSILNSLYGKFGQKNFDTTEFCRTIEEMYNMIEDDTTKLTALNMYNDKVMFSYKTVGDEYNNIGQLMRFSSYIAMTTRCKLAQLKRDVGHENVYYCDTDSIFTSKKPRETFLDENILGKWKIECDPIIRAVFLAPKTYYYMTETGETCKKSKGIKSNLLGTKDYDALAEGTIEKIGKKDVMFFRSFDNVKIYDKERRIRTVYNKRIWAANNSKPFDNIEAWEKNKK